ncbi:MAG: T9SS type A sorting domain-containing protein [Bacteroidales bacterium]|nr:T9SS type A sorting domain-containing protein [Bacteroidales bacterium]
MKKILLSLIALFFAISVFGQGDVIEKNYIYTKATPKVAPTKVKVEKLVMGKNYDLIGQTNYDLQTNASSAQRLVCYPDGKMSAVWIQYQGSSVLTAPDRGTGYAHYDGTEWVFDETSGNQRLEGTQRAGWGTLMTNGTEEMNISHISSSNGLFCMSQTVGSAGSSWSRSDITSGTEPMLWPCTASSGDNYYAIAVDDYTANSSDIEGLHFYRSPDAGANWSYEGILPEFSTHFAHAGGDNYSIDARDDIVAIVYMGAYNDAILWKSTDNGDNWDITVIGDMPDDGYNNFGAIYDHNSNSVADTIISTDGSCDVVIDSDGLVHVVFSKGGHIDNESTGEGDAGFYFYLLSDWVVYWNESYGEATWNESLFDGDRLEMAFNNLDTIGYSFDLDGNDTIWNFAAFAPNGTSISSLSSIASSDDGYIFVAFQTVMDGDNYVNPNATPEPESFRGVFILTRTPEGEWLDPFLVSDNSGEWVFPNLAKNIVDGKVRLITQYDNEPGTYMDTRNDPEPDPITDNYIIYIEIPVTTLTGVKEISANQLNINVYPNPATDFVTVENVEGATISVYNTLGSLVETIVADGNTTTIDMANYAAGTYILKVASESGVGSAKIVKIK